MSNTDRELVRRARRWMAGHEGETAFPFVEIVDALERRLDDAEAHQGKRADEAWLASFRWRIRTQPREYISPDEADRLLAHIDALSDMLCDAARSSDYALGHQQARREIAEMLEEKGGSPSRRPYYTMDEVITYVHALPDPGEVPPWASMLADNDRLRAVLRWIADVWISDGSMNYDDLRKRVHAVLKGEVQHG